MAEVPTLCPFALITGRACPGCGMTRAMIHLFRTEWVAAWTLHPLAPLLLIAVVIASVWWTGTRRFDWKPISQRLLDQTLIGTVCLFVGVWVLRWTADGLPPVSPWSGQ